MKYELDKAYNPSLFEDKIYQDWEASGCFNPDNLKCGADAPSYTIVLPPPNITDKLHMGHAATIAIEDLMVRYKRLRGYRTLWLPGTDHAAIATQNVVEKKLLRERGLTRHDLGREKFLEEVWSFLKATQDKILLQTRKAGASLDWSRLAFTLDEPRQLAVRTMFQKMYDEGVIYRGERIVNWCPRCHSTLADDEVDYHDNTAKFYTFRYDKNFPIAISTTRPETKLGDTAVAVNPKDERYKQYIGREFEVDFCGQALKIRVIADHNVDQNLGTGALGVTPAHSMVDWQMAANHKLETIKVINEDGFIHEGFGAYSGLSVIEARLKVVESLRVAGLLEKEEEISNNLSACYRCGTAIEPLPSRQWFVAVDKPLERLSGKSLKEAAIDAARQSIQFIPERFSKRYLDWMNNLHDWCISRQIWFGHRIPVWYRGEEAYVGVEPPQGDGWIQDSDTLDTWFSSGMWTFSTLAWPSTYQNGQKSGDLLKFHPTQMLETGYEIITLWVSRMIMMSIFALGEIPFEKVYLHGMVLDSQGKKMSKSKGNGIDPLDMIEKFGADAMRLSLLTGSTPGNDTRFSEDKVEAKRNFINKLWNISRFILSNTDEKYHQSSTTVEPEALTDWDHWILGELRSTSMIVSHYLDDYNFSLAAEELESFTWDKLADWYLEAAKVEKNKDEILVYLLKTVLSLWHPFIPFVTEVIWNSFNDSKLIISPWPSILADKNWVARHQDSEPVKNVKFLQDIIIAIRNARSENKVEPARKVKAHIYAPDSQDIISRHLDIIKNLKTGLEDINLKDDANAMPGAIFTTVAGADIYLEGAVDPQKEKARLEKERLNLEKMIASLEAQLANKEFTAKAPENIVSSMRERRELLRSDLNKLYKA